jgi:hypothetical protein
MALLNQIGASVMSISAAIASLRDYPWMVALANDLANLHAEHGCPEPADGPSTDVRGGARDLQLDEIGEWDGHEEEALSLYTESLHAADACIDLRHVGGDLVYTQYYAGSVEWREYSDAARDVIRDFASYYMWELFCDLADIGNDAEG